MSVKIVVVEDDPSYRLMLREALAQAGYQVIEADTADHALRLIRSELPQLVVLDRALPGGTGVDVCKQVRADPALRATPVIMLTAMGELPRKAEGFEAGADHYLVKPIPLPELLLWVKALLRRAQGEESEEAVIKVGDLVIDVAAQLVRFRDQRVDHLTQKEFELLCYLVRKRPNVVSRKQILTRLWHTVAVDKLVDTHLGNLRKKLPPELRERLQTVSGRGFRFLE